MDTFPPIEEKATPSSAPTRSYLFGKDVIVQKDAESEEHLLADGHGTTRAVTNATGTITETYNFDAFGNPVGFSAATALTTYLTTDGTYTPALGTHWHGGSNSGRYSDRTMGRWLGRDSFFGYAEDPLSQHSYTFVHHDPANGADPTGMFIMLDFQVANGIRNMLSAMYTGSAVGVRLAARSVFENLTLTSVVVDYIVDLILDPIEDLIAMVSSGPILAEKAFRWATDTPAQGALWTAGGLVVFERVSSTVSGVIVGTLQKNHLNQAAAFAEWGITASNGVRIKLQGYAGTEGTEHNRFHAVMDRFFDDFRPGTGTYNRPPTVAEYNRALYEALRNVGLSTTDIREAMNAALREQREYGIGPDAELNIPHPVTSQAARKDIHPRWRGRR